MQKLRYLIILIICSVSINSSFAQSSVKGIVAIQNSGGKPAFPAQVKAFGATETATNSNGEFHLSFINKSPGEDVSIEVIKDGYEVVNKTDLFTRIPQQGESKILAIYMCPQGAWQENAIKYFGINEQVITKKFRAKVAMLEKQLAGSEIEANKFKQEIGLLEKQRDDAIKQASKLSEKFAKANLDVESKRYIKAFNLFTSGKIDSVILVLNEEEILKEVEIAKNTLERATKEFLLKAEAYIVNLDWENAERTYRLAIQTSPDSYEAVVDFGQFLENQLRYKEAIVFYEKARTLGADQKVPQILFTAFLNDLARFYSNFGRVKESKATFRQAIDTWESHLEKSPNSPTAKMGLARCLVNYGNLLNDEKESLNESIIVYKKAIPLTQQYHEDLPSTLTKDLGNPQIAIANIKNLISLSFKYKAQLDSAEFYMIEAVSMLDATEAANENDLFMMSIIYMNYGNLLKWGTMLWSDEFKTDGNFQDFISKNINVKGELADGNARSIPFYEKAIKIQKKLYEDNPKKYRFELARLYENIAAAWEIEDIEKANPYYLEAITLYLELYSYDPNFYLSRMVNVLSKFSFQFYYPIQLWFIDPNSDTKEQLSADEIEETIAMFEFCVSRIIDINQLIYDSIIKYHPGICSSDKTYILQREIVKINLCKELINKAYKKSKSGKLLLLLSNLEQLLVSFECENSKKAALMKSAISYLEDYSKKEPNDEESYKNLSQMYGNLSWYLIFDSKFKEAEKAALNGLKINPDAIWIKTNLAHSYLFQGKEKKAEDVYLSLKDVRYSENQTFTEVLLEDFESLKKVGLNHKNFTFITNKLMK